MGLQRIFKLAVVIAALIVIGTVGFVIIEQWPLLDALYMTVITISTVGFGEIRELSPTGRTFTGCLILVSIVCMCCWTAGITSVFVDGDIRGVFLQRRMKRMANRFKNHVIICGSGVFARSILELLYANNHQVAMVCNDAGEAEVIRRQFPDVAVIEKPPTDELALALANLASARCVVAATQADVDNLLISMTCKDLNPQLPVYTYSLEGNLAGRMAKLGVDEVICPYLLGGSRVVELVESTRSGGGQLSTDAMLQGVNA
ncbi:MAG: potassium channel family protein [Pirellulaceae bacterium]